MENNLQEHVLMEREILMQLDHPFIIKLICAFQDTRYVYFLLELLIGGELFTFLRERRRETTRFFSIRSRIIRLDGAMSAQASTSASRSRRPRSTRRA